MTKKLLSLIVAVLMVLTVLPTGAFAQTKAPSAADDAAEPELIRGYYFESQDEFNQFTLIDNDGDGTNWNYYNWGTSSAYEGAGVARDVFKADPDNWLVAPAFTVPAEAASVSFYTKMASSTWPEKLQAYVGTSPEVESMTALDEEAFTCTLLWEKHEYDLSDYAGQTIYFAIRHYQSPDKYYVYVDSLEFFGIEGDEPVVTDEPDETVITLIDVDGFVEPVDGAPAESLSALSVPEGAHYMIDQISVVDETGAMLYEGDTLEAGKYYMVGAMVETDIGYTFDQDAEITANGGDMEINTDESYIESQYVAYVVVGYMECIGEPDITEEPAQVIDLIEIENYESPVAGENAEDHVNVTVPDDAHYSIDFEWTYWYDITEDDAFEEGAFVLNQPYALTVRVIADEGYVFDEYAEVTVNGDTALVDDVYTDLYDETTFDVWTVEEIAAAPEVEPTAEPSEAPADDPVYGWYFESDDEIADFIFVDADNDGKGWSRLTSQDYAYEGTGCMVSRWNSTTNVDNWMIIPNVEIPAENASVTFYGRKVSNWTEYVGVYVGTTAVPAEMNAVGEKVLLGTAYDQYSFDLSEYAGQTVCLGIRHFDSTDQYNAYVDQLEIWGENGTEPTDEPVDNTVYDVNVQGHVTPVGGKTPADYMDAHAPEGEHYTVTGIRWYSEYDLRFMEDDEEFVAGREYSVSYLVETEEGWYFADDYDLYFYINDDYALVDYENSWREDGTICHIWALPVTAEEGEPYEMSDLDRALNVEGGNIHFVSEGDYPWITAEEGDRFYAMSGNAGISSSTSTVSAVITAEEGDILQFDFKAWGEGSGNFWDHCDFYIDGERVLYYGAYDNEWETFTCELEAGEHELVWSYTKDSSVNPNGDYFAVDNVCVGEPTIPETVEVEDIEVFEGRYANVVYTVLPEDAFDKSVTFAIEDESIATVNALGVVHGVAIGTTTITVTSVADPTVFGTATVNVVEAPPAVDLFGFVGYDVDGNLDYNWITFTDVDPGTVTPLGGMDNTYGGAFYNGYVYGYIQATGAFYMRNIETGEVVIDDNVILEDTLLDMAYDYSTHTMYALVQREVDNYYPCFIVTVDIETGETTDVAQIEGTSGTLLTLAIDGEGNAYGTCTGTNAGFYSIDLATGACTLIGSTGVPMDYIQSMHWDMNTNRLFWAEIYSTSVSGLYEVDPETGAATLLGTIGTSGMEICGLFTIYYENGPQPEIIDTIEINDFEIPEYGANPDFDFTVPEDAHYFITDVAWTMYYGDEVELMDPEDVFDDPAASYYALIVLDCEEGYEFAEECVVTINGEEALVEYGFVMDGEYCVATIDFTVEEPILWGDANGDGIVDTTDVLLIMRYTLGLEEISEEQLPVCDVNGDGVIDFTDALLVLRKVMSIIELFPVEE